MSRVSIRSSIENLKKTDIYSLMMFALFKITDIPEYSTLGELVYTIDMKNFLKICEYFGGITIKVPTVDEIEILVYALMIYQLVDIEGNQYESSINNIKNPYKYLKEVKKVYLKLQDILQENNFEGHPDGI